MAWWHLNPYLRVHIVILRLPRLAPINSTVALQLCVITYSTTHTHVRSTTDAFETNSAAVSGNVIHIEHMVV